MPSPFLFNLPILGRVLENHAKKTRTMKQKKTVSVSFMMMGILFCVCLITSNLLEAKVFRVCGPLTLTGGFLIFPISYILNDCIAEVWGYAKARLVIWVGFLMNFFVMAMAGIACVLPPLEPNADAAFVSVYSFAPQIVAASLIAFLVGSFLNAMVMSRRKVIDRHKGHFNLYFSFRAILSTLVGESADSLVFFPLAFYLLPLLFSGAPVLSVPVMVKIMATQVVLKTLYEVLALPITLRIVKRIKAAENTDVFDDGISYNAFRITDL